MYFFFKGNMVVDCTVLFSMCNFCNNSYYGPIDVHDQKLIYIHVHMWSTMSVNYEKMDTSALGSNTGSRHLCVYRIRVIVKAAI